MKRRMTGRIRRDKKRRILRPGESVRIDGKYQFKYMVDGKPKFFYSWKLEPTDPLPPGRKPCRSLREIDAKVEMVPLRMNAYDVISKALQEYGIGSRIEISYYRKMRDYGHVIVRYNDMGKPRFIDVQEGTVM